MLSRSDSHRASPRACAKYVPIAACRPQTRTLGEEGGETELELGGLVDDVDQHPNTHRQRPLVQVERRLMQIELRAAACPHAEGFHRSGHLLEIPREVLAAAGLPGAAQHVGADRLDGMRENACRYFFVDH